MLEGSIFEMLARIQARKVWGWNRGKKGKKTVFGIKRGLGERSLPVTFRPVCEMVAVTVCGADKAAIEARSAPVGVGNWLGGSPGLDLGVGG